MIGYIVRLAWVMVLVFFQKVFPQAIEMSQ